MSKAATTATPAASRVIVGRLHRNRKGKRTTFEPASQEPPAEPGPARVALALALGHSIQRWIDSGEVRDQAAAARGLGISRARVTQLLDLTLLAPEIQAAVLGVGVAVESGPHGTRRLGTVARQVHWPVQVSGFLRRKSSRPD